MRTRPDDLDDGDLVASVAAGWGLRPESAEYTPEGGGSHHWNVRDASGRRFFATVDDLDTKDWFGDTRDGVFIGLQRALRAAVCLQREAGLDFVVAAVPTANDEVVRRLDDRYALSLYPFVVGQTEPFGPYRDRARRGEVLKMLVALHGATAAVRELAPAHQPGVGCRRDLDAFLQEPECRWTAGPFSKSAHETVMRHANELGELLEAFDELVARTKTARSDLVITHGEPHPANVIWESSRLRVVDWDTMAIAPAERDVWMVASDDAEVAGYSELAGRSLQREVMTLYGVRWYLDDIASAVQLFRHPHLRTADAERWRAGLSRQIQELPNWRRVLGC